MVLLVDRAHLTGPCKGTLFAVIVLDVNDYLFDMEYSMVAKQKKKE